jgi:choline dehydrogenase-like flavoprotein
MTQTPPAVLGRPTGGKPINLKQLQSELVTDGVGIGPGLGLHADYVYTYDADGQPADFAPSDQHKVDRWIADHVAMRDKTDAEHSTEFQNPAISPERKQEIRDILAGLLPREHVPMT